MSGPVRVITPEGGPAALGEAPTWWAREELLIWTDILQRQFHLYDPTTRRDRAVKTVMPITRVLCRGTDLIAVTPEGLCRLDPLSGALRPFAWAADLPPGSRFNDAAIDGAGRIWAGTIGAPGRSGDGRLYRHDSANGLVLMGEGYDACNGIGFSLEQSALYLTDTRRRAVLTFDYDAVSGSIGVMRVLREFGGSEGYPDGLSVSATGSLWHAMWDGGCLAETLPCGATGRIHPLHVQRPTALAFTPHGVFVTTAGGGQPGADDGALIEIDRTVFD